jgi:hypothetical protein
MGIVMMSAPMLISTSTQSTYVALQQEGINEAASRIQMVLGYAWDEANANVEDNYVPTILHTTSLTADLLEVGTTTRRIGIPMESQRSYKLSDPAGSEFTASTTLGSDVGDSDDMDDYIADTTVDPIEAATIDYIEQQGQLNINTAITYGADSVPGGYSQNIITYTPFGASASTTSNVKNITVTLTSTSGVADLTKNIVLRAFACNIGGYEFEEREF